MTTCNALFTLVAETSIHAGASESEGAVDLPIQREKHSGWPCIYGSGVKGALRAKAKQQALADIKTLFGPEPKDDNASDFAGSLLVSDARLLLLPVRSLTGHYRWVCCPAILKRLERDLQRLGYESDSLAVDKLNANEVLRPDHKEGDRLYLEEYAFASAGPVPETVMQQLTKMLGEDYRTELQDKLAIISDDSFTHLCQAAIAVHAHIAIESNTKRVMNGALWHEESLSPDTVMYISLMAQRGRNGDMTAENVMAVVSDHLLAKPYLQVGGNETTGMGWFHIHPVGEGV
ncbi:type III-B CRISPR module RAMP protein Cmr4 [Endozoicomonas sp.]|uniref:type III-B CRISPR module RAMP protein Cmr4 n=1 Tax=Endozoicomonas sp. TaxID=1892382 RepID=UPI002886637B|nr:type III-B CRISPR module RAMP protein Cmr4 [Endozoicomonas sp.]